ncbi:hypothetical protein LCGC14_0716190 [marine sediment metagenome]|uniref:Uncharacterized protein n=1 Tax=marine sediment metagenome TaxID=412755 RepID=A0A0F9QDM9_9ZZZZ
MEYKGANRIVDDWGKSMREAAWALEVFGGMAAYYLQVLRPGQWCALYPELHYKHGNCPGVSKRNSRVVRN